jgi:hypothetical protein
MPIQETSREDIDKFRGNNQLVLEQLEQQFRVDVSALENGDGYALRLNFDTETARIFFEETITNLTSPALANYHQEFLDRLAKLPMAVTVAGPLRRSTFHSLTL